MKRLLVTNRMTRRSVLSFTIQWEPIWEDDISSSDLGSSNPGCKLLQEILHKEKKKIFAERGWKAVASFWPRRIQPRSIHKIDLREGRGAPKREESMVFYRPVHHTHVLVHFVKSNRAYNVKSSSTLFSDNIQWNFEIFSHVQDSSARLIKTGRFHKMQQNFL